MESLAAPTPGRVQISGVQFKKEDRFTSSVSPSLKKMWIHQWTSSLGKTEDQMGPVLKTGELQKPAPVLSTINGVHCPASVELLEQSGASPAHQHLQGKHLPRDKEHVRSPAVPESQTVADPDPAVRVPEPHQTGLGQSSNPDDLQAEEHVRSVAVPESQAVTDSDQAVQASEPHQTGLGQSSNPDDHEEQYGASPAHPHQGGFQPSVSPPHQPQVPVSTLERAGPQAGLGQWKNPDELSHAGVLPATHPHQVGLQPDVPPHLLQQDQDPLHGHQLVEQPPRLRQTLLGLAARGLVRHDLLQSLLNLEEKQLSWDKTGHARGSSDSSPSTSPSLVTSSLVEWPPPSASVASTPSAPSLASTSSVSAPSTTTLASEWPPSTSRAVSTPPSPSSASLGSTPPPPTSATPVPTPTPSVPSLASAGLVRQPPPPFREWPPSTEWPPASLWPPPTTTTASVRPHPTSRTASTPSSPSLASAPSPPSSRSASTSLAGWPPPPSSSVPAPFVPSLASSTPASLRPPPPFREWPPSTSSEWPPASLRSPTTPAASEWPDPTSRTAPTPSPPSLASAPSPPSMRSASTSLAGWPPPPSSSVPAPFVPSLASSTLVEWPPPPFREWPPSTSIEWPPSSTTASTWSPPSSPASEWPPLLRWVSKWPPPSSMASQWTNQLRWASEWPPPISTEWPSSTLIEWPPLSPASEWPRLLMVPWSSLRQLSTGLVGFWSPPPRSNCEWLSAPCTSLTVDKTCDVTAWTVHLNKETRLTDDHSFSLGSDSLKPKTYHGKVKFLKFPFDRGKNDQVQNP